MLGRNSKLYPYYLAMEVVFCFLMLAVTIYLAIDISPWFYIATAISSFDVVVALYMVYNYIKNKE